MTGPDRHDAAAPGPSDYRRSHLEPGKGESYHATFAKNPYRRLLWDMEKAVLDRIVREKLRGRALRHLDFACGTGRVLEHLAPRASESVGVDVSPSMLDVARARGVRSEIIEADLTVEDVLGGREFDLITAFRFFPNAQPSLRDQAMGVLVRHLAAGGRIVFNDHRNLSSLNYRLARLRGKGGFEGMSIAEARELAARHGLEIERSVAMGFAPAGDERALLPPALLRPLERLLSGWPAVKAWGENIVFVCRRHGRA